MGSNWGPLATGHQLKDVIGGDSSSNLCCCVWLFFFSGAVGLVSFVIGGRFLLRIPPTWRCWLGEVSIFGARSWAESA